MATDFRFSPSHFKGIFLVGLRSGKEHTPLPHYAEAQLGVSFGILRGIERALHSLETDFYLNLKKAGTLARFWGSPG
jgi:hypothetical protein